MSREDRTAFLRSLIRSVADVDDARVRPLLDRASKTLKDFKGPRVNQFAVQDRLHGLIERAEILNRDDLGQALSLRIAKTHDLSDKFMPEYLTLLLELSDNAIDKTDLESLDSIKDASSGKQLSWEDIIRDDPLDNANGLWDNVDFAGDESSDEDDLSLASEGTHGTADLTSLSLHRDINNASRHLATNQAFEDIETLETLRSEWAEVKANAKQDNDLISEMQVMRETIFMLRGYNTDLFEISNGRIAPRTHVEVKHLSQGILQGLLQHFSNLGERASAARKHSRVITDISVLQTYQSCLSGELHSFDLVLSGLESRCLIASEESPTILELLDEVRASCKTLLPLGDICKKIIDFPDQEITALDSLFDLASKQQVVGDLDALARTVDAFNKCFQTYLQPINDWIFEGKIDEDRTATFLYKVPAILQQRKTWSSDVEITLDRFQQPMAPAFLQPFATTIFNTGKSLRFLHALGKETEGVASIPFSMGNIGTDLNACAYTPFSEQFRQSFEQWLKPIHQHVTTALSNSLRFECGLQRTIDALHDIFLGQAGPSLDLIADSVLLMYARSPSQLADSAALTGVYQEAFTLPDNVSEDLISIRPKKLSLQSQIGTGIGGLLSMMEVSYRMPWAVSNIVLPAALDSYRRIHGMLVRLRVAKRAIDEKFHQKMIKYGATQSRIGVQAWRLSHRLRWFVHTLQSYFLGIAIQDAIPPFLRKLNEPGDLDLKIGTLSTFVHDVEKRLLLHESATTAHQAIESILDLVVTAASYLQRQWMSLHLTASLTAAGVSPDDEPLPLADIEESVERLKGFEATYTRFLSFMYTSVQESARAEGDRCLQMLVDSLSFGVPSQMSVG